MSREKLQRRHEAHEAVAASVAALSDEALAALLDAAAWRTSYHGSQTTVLEIAGHAVFAKRIALTERELAAGPPGAVTADLFGLPRLYQYAVGSTGFGAGRELAAARATSGWVLAGECPHFPILHHARVLPRTPPDLSERQQAWLANIPTFWSGSPAVIERVDAVTRAPANIVLIQERLPQNLQDWLATVRPTGTAIVEVHGQLTTALGFMNGHGLHHFDLQAQNVMTDGEDLYITDFGYALSAGFDLNSAERELLTTHADYDRAYVCWAFVEWLKADKRHPAAVRAILAREATVAALFDAFISAVPGTAEAPPAPFPAHAVAQALAALPAAAPQGNRYPPRP